MAVLRVLQILDGKSAGFWVFNGTILLQLWNASLPILVTLLPMVMLVRPVQPLNA
jgi:hypothetical protein